MVEGIVLSRIKGFYQVQDEHDQIYECKVKGNLFQHSMYDNQIAVGDRVVYEINHDVGLIIKILPRTSFLSRTRIHIKAEQILAANIDYLLIVSAVKSPPLRHNLIQRMIVAAEIGNLKPILILTKTDLQEDHVIQKLIQLYASILEVLPFSIYQKNDLTQLKSKLESHISVVAGHSGTGKSTLLNHLFPTLNLKTGALSQKTQKGQHTTTKAQMHRIAPHGYIVDTPGIREYGLYNLKAEDLTHYYPMFKPFSQQCFHRNCRHLTEPGCAVKIAVQNAQIPIEFYTGYQALYQSIQHDQ